MKRKSVFLNRLSIQQRLPLLICTFLLSAIVLYGLANYYSLKKAALIIGKDRLTSVTGQVSSMLAQSAQFLLKASHQAAASKEVIQFFKTNGTQYRIESLKQLDGLSRDTTWVSMELTDADGKTILRSEKSKVKVAIDSRSVLTFNHLAPDSGRVGKIYMANGSMYYPIISTVNDGGHVLGYIICWKLLQSTPKALEQFSQLVGTGAGIYVGNTDESLWTNTVKPISGPPVKINHFKDIIEYKDSEGRGMLAKSDPVAYTNWIVVIGFPEKVLLSSVNDFMSLIVIGGLVLIIMGVIAAWIMSRNISRPLAKLTNAATAISQGDYSATVDIYRKDELGELANSFNNMAIKVYKMHRELERKVAERTQQLENVNKELEAFSYSVSHDLRTPLRAINGYSVMLKEDYEDKLDAEGMRILDNVIGNAKTMGQLIDELLAFARLGKKELTLLKVDMKQLAETVAAELVHNEEPGKYKINIDPSLPPVEGDGSMIKQAMMNLVGNAIKYSAKKKEPEIWIGAKAESDRTVYYVQDNGVGFDMAYASKLFGVFQRLHSIEEFPGTGVGLALVKRIIDKHKGQVWADAVKGEGATFYFTLPNN
jgi:signal transduction histidine kinase